MAAVHVIVLRKKTQIFLDLFEDTPVIELKRMLGGILKVLPDKMRLFYKSQGNELQNDKILLDYNIKSVNTKPQDPAYLGLVLRMPDDSGWEPLEITPMSKVGAPRSLARVTY